MESGITALITELNDIEATMNRLQNYMQTIESQAKGNGIKSQDREKGRHEGFDELEMDSYSELQQMALSMREDYEDLYEIKNNLISKIKDVDQILNEQQNSANKLQQGLISSQMIPFATLFPSLRRLTHQLAQTLGKEVSIKFTQTEDRLDRTVTQVLIGPLEHMIRNAIDHGIEKPQQRLEQGKPAQAQIEIKLYRQAGNIVLDVCDDGAGIKIEKVRQKAIDQGLLSATEDVSEQELLQFLLHTNSAPETITRLLDLGLDPVNFSDALLGILAQRLMRTLCKNCKEAYVPEAKEIDHLIGLYGEEAFPELGVDPDAVELYRAKGCPECGDTGYRGRVGVHEVLVGTPELQAMIYRKAPLAEIKQQASRDGMRTLRQDGIAKIFQGLSDYEQLLSITAT